MQPWCYWTGTWVLCILDVRVLGPLPSLCTMLYIADDKRSNACHAWCNAKRNGMLKKKQLYIYSWTVCCSFAHAPFIILLERERWLLVIGFESWCIVISLSVNIYIVIDFQSWCIAISLYIYLLDFSVSLFLIFMSVNREVGKWIFC